ncbi:MAG: hypothetical protein NXI21_07540 [Alphaproteobacteria bacterium]|nr:hypothetical protein [Alphaproteobacteria bacterium]
MLIDGASLAALSLFDRATGAADRLGAAVIQPGGAGPSGGGAASVGADAFEGRAFGVLIGAQGLALLQAPPDASNESPERGRRGPDEAARDPATAEAEARAEPPPGEAAEAETGPDGLTDEERQEVQQLQQRDAEVRRHEQAHQAAGGPYAGAAVYQYQRGPDNRLYAIGGEVRIDASAVPGDPQATIAKMRIVRRAALAPPEPSPQDLRVAASAQQRINQASAELRQQELEERRAAVEGSEPPFAPEGPPGASGDAPVFAADQALRAQGAFEAAAARAARGDEPSVAGLFGADGAPLDRAPLDLLA